MAAKAPRECPPMLQWNIGTDECCCTVSSFVVVVDEFKTVSCCCCVVVDDDDDNTVCSTRCRMRCIRVGSAPRNGRAIPKGSIDTTTTSIPRSDNAAATSAYALGGTNAPGKNKSACCCIVVVLLFPFSCVSLLCRIVLFLDGR